MTNKTKDIKTLIISVLLIASLVLTGCTAGSVNREKAEKWFKESQKVIDKLYGENLEQINSSSKVNPEDIPEYSGEPFLPVNENVPEFTDDERTAESYEYYSDLDWLGRCGETIANVGQDLMPKEKRGSIGSVKPTGWHTVKYDNVQGKYLYNRCHLIGYQLSGENANRKNLITGTRYMNVEGMLPFENMVADYVKETGNHVLYRVTPIFDGDDLVAKGVQMEAESVEDGGKDISFNVFVYNVQPGINIDYNSGESSLR